MRGAGGPVTLNVQSFSEKSKHPFIHLDENRPSFRVKTDSLYLQKPLRLGHSHASMAAALALHGFAGAVSESPLEGVAEAPTKSGITLRAGAGLYCKATHAHLRHSRVALATKPCFQEHQTRTAHKSLPQGALSLTLFCGQFYYSINPSWSYPLW